MRANSLASIARHFDVTLPTIELPLGGVVGVTRIVDCVSRHPSIWFEGPFGFVLEEILAAGGHDRLVTCFVDFLHKYQARRKSKPLIQRVAGGADLADLLAAYRRVAGDRTSSKPHRDL